MSSITNIKGLTTLLRQQGVADQWWVYDGAATWEGTYGVEDVAFAGKESGYVQLWLCPNGGVETWIELDVTSGRITLTPEYVQVFGEPPEVGNAAAKAAGKKKQRAESEEIDYSKPKDEAKGLTLLRWIGFLPAGFALSFLFFEAMQMGLLPMFSSPGSEVLPTWLLGILWFLSGAIWALTSLLMIPDKHLLVGSSITILILGLRLMPMFSADAPDFSMEILMVHLAAPIASILVTLKIWSDN